VWNLRGAEGGVSSEVAKRSFRGVGAAGATWVGGEGTSASLKGLRRKRSEKGGWWPVNGTRKGDLFANCRKELVTSQSTVWGKKEMGVDGHLTFFPREKSCPQCEDGLRFERGHQTQTCKTSCRNFPTERETG